MHIHVFLWRPHEGAARTEEEWQAAWPHSRTGRRLLSIIRSFQPECLVTNLMPFSPTAYAPDERFIRAQLSARPRIVLAFGMVAHHILPYLWAGPLIVAPHPNARYLVDGDPLFFAIRDELSLSPTRRVYMNRNKFNVITRDPLAEPGPNAVHP